MSIDKDLLDQLMEGRAPSDLFGKDGILSELTKALAERALSTELDAHLDEERADGPSEGQNQPPNRRNGSSPKTVTTDSGKLVLDIPRDRNGSFDPLLIAKYQSRFPAFDSKIISMYARGMTTREIQGHIEEIYGVEALPQPDFGGHRRRHGRGHRLAEPAAGTLLPVHRENSAPRCFLIRFTVHGRDPRQDP